MKTETPREIAVQVAQDWKKRHFISALNMRMENLIDGIEAALNAERERCAKIVNDARVEGHADLRELVSRIRGKD